MSDKIKGMLDEVIEAKILAIGSLKTTNEEQGSGIDDLVKLYKLRIEEAKNEMDICEKQAARIMGNESEKQAARNQLSEQVKDRYFKIGITTAEIILPLAFYAVWMKRGFVFEETGAFTSTTFKGLINRFKPTKK